MSLWAGSGVFQDRRGHFLVTRDEQARSGYSLSQQMEASGAYAARECYEILDGARKALEAELAALEHNRQRADELERNRDAALASLAASIPEALDNHTDEEINTVYRKLRLPVVPRGERYDATGVLCTLRPTAASGGGARSPRELRKV
jgi:hypothetical protein